MRNIERELLLKLKWALDVIVEQQCLEYLEDEDICEFEGAELLIKELDASSQNELTETPVPPADCP